MKHYITNGCKSILDLKVPEKAIKLVKDYFESNLASELKLRRVTASLFVKRGTGVIEDLTGIERPVSFIIKDMDDTIAEIVDIGEVQASIWPGEMIENCQQTGLKLM